MDEVIIGIKSTFNDKGTNEATRALGKVALLTKALGKEQVKTGDSTSRMSSKVKNLDNNFEGLNKRMDKMQHTLARGLMPVMKTVTTSVGMLRMALLPAVVGLAGFVASLAGSKLILGAVHLATKAWTIALKGMGAGVAVALSGVSMLASAMSELKAAANAPFTGQSSRQLQGIWGNLIGDPEIAAMGVDNIQSASAALLKMKVPVGDINKYMKELGDYGFYAGGGDAGKGLSQIILAMKTMGTGTMDSKELETFSKSFGDMAPNIQEAGKAFVGKDTQAFINFLTSNPASLAQFNTGLDELNNTMMGTIKTFRPVMQSAIEPFGQTLNDVTKGPLGGFRDYLAGLIKDIMPHVVVFFSRQLPGAINKIIPFLDKVIEKFKGVLGSIGTVGEGSKHPITDFFHKISEGWKKVKPVLEGMAKGWDALWGFMKPVLKGIGDLLGRGSMAGAKSLDSTAEKWKSAGESIGQVFRSGGPVEKSIQTVWSFVKVIGQTLGPAIGQILSALKSPLYILDEISKHPDALKKTGSALADAAKKAAPIFDLIKDVIGQMIEHLPEVAGFLSDMVGAAASLASAIKPFVTGMISALSAVGGIKVIMAWMIGKAIMSKVASLAISMSGMSQAAALAGNTSPSSQMGMLAGQKGWRGAVGKGVGNIPALMMGGMGIMYGSQISSRNDGVAGSTMGLLTSTGSGAAAGAMVAGIPGAVIGALVGLVTNVVTSAARLGDSGMSEKEAGKLAKYYEANGVKSGNVGAYKVNAQAIANKTQEDINRGLIPGVGGSDDVHQAVEKTRQEMDAAQKSVAANVGMFTKGWTSTYGLLNTKTKVVNGLIMSSIPKIPEKQIEDFLLLADRAGIDLSDGAMTLTEGAGIIAQAAKELKPVGNIVSDAFERLVFKPMRDAEWAKKIDVMGVDITASIANNGYDPNVVKEYGSTIMQDIIQNTMSGMDPESAFAKGKADAEKVRLSLEAQVAMLTEAARLDPKNAEKAVLAWNATAALSTWSTDVLAKIDEVQATSMTQIEKQQADFNELVTTMASALGSSIGGVLDTLDKGARDSLNGILGLSGIKFSIGKDGTLSVTSGGYTKSSTNFTGEGPGIGGGGTNGGPVGAPPDTYSPRFNTVALTSPKSPTVLGDSVTPRFSTGAMLVPKRDAVPGASAPSRFDAVTLIEPMPPVAVGDSVTPRFNSVVTLSSEKPVEPVLSVTQRFDKTSLLAPKSSVAPVDSVTQRFDMAPLVAPKSSVAIGDSAAPKMALLNTQRVHQMVDGGISGKRTVTSMWRNHSLGSSNSDHVTGRALDVTGQNLGAYATKVKEMGGFAEFHGSGAERHLHVVPPQLPVGDRPSPRPPTNMAHQSQVSQNIQTTVYAPQGMDEEMIARKVARHTASTMRDMAERS